MTTAFESVEVETDKLGSENKLLNSSRLMLFQVISLSFQWTPDKVYFALAAE